MSSGTTKSISANLPSLVPPFIKGDLVIGRKNDANQ